MGNSMYFPKKCKIPVFLASCQTCWRAEVLGADMCGTLEKITLYSKMHQECPAGVPAP